MTRSTAGPRRPPIIVAPAVACQRERKPDHDKRDHGDSSRAASCAGSSANRVVAQAKRPMRTRQQAEGRRELPGSPSQTRRFPAADDRGCTNDDRVEHRGARRFRQPFPRPPSQSEHCLRHELASATTPALQPSRLRLMRIGRLDRPRQATRGRSRTITDICPCRMGRFETGLTTTCTSCPRIVRNSHQPAYRH